MELFKSAQFEQRRGAKMHAATEIEKRKTTIFETNCSVWTKLIKEGQKYAMQLVAIQKRTNIKKNCNCIVGAIIQAN